MNTTHAFNGLGALGQTARNAPILTREAEHRLAVEAQAGNKQAFDELVRAHFRLVLSITREHRSFGLPADELVSEGLLGLCEAARRFDPSRGVRLSTYAVWWIRAYVRRHTIVNRRIVRVPSSREDRKLLAWLRTTQRKLTQQDGEPPSSQRVADELGVSVAAVEEMEAALSARDVPCTGNGDGDAVQLSADHPTPEAIVASEQEDARAVKAVNGALEALSPRERRVVELRYLSPATTTLAHIGTRLGISRERVRQIEQRAVERMRVAVNA